MHPRSKRKCKRSPLAVREPSRRVYSGSNREGANSATDAPEFSGTSRIVTPKQVMTVEEQPAFPVLPSSSNLTPKWSNTTSSFPVQPLYSMPSNSTSSSADEAMDRDVFPEKNTDLQFEDATPPHVELMEEGDDVDLIVEPDENHDEEMQHQNLLENGQEILEQGEVEVMQLEEDDEEDFRGFDELYVFQINDDDDEDDFEAFDMEEVEPPLMLDGNGQWGEYKRRRG